MNNVIYKYWLGQLKDYKADFLKKEIPFKLRKYEQLDLLSQLHFSCNYKSLKTLSGFSHEYFQDLPDYFYSEDSNKRVFELFSELKKNDVDYRLNKLERDRIIEYLTLEHSNSKDFYLDHFDDYLNSNFGKAILHYLNDRNKGRGLKVYLRKQYDWILGEKCIHNVQKYSGNIVHLEFSGDRIRTPVEAHYTELMIDRIMEHKDVDAIFCPDFFTNQLGLSPKSSVTKVANYYWGHQEVIIGIENLDKI